MTRLRILILVLLCSLGSLSLMAAEANNADNADNAGNQSDGSQSDGQLSADGAAEPVTDSEDPQTDEENMPEESPTRFIPTEQISQDLGVSFPVDI